MYSCAVSTILVAMIVTGAARTVAIQLFYQLGFEQPMFVTLLYLLGQSLSLVVYFVSSRVSSYLEKQRGSKNLEEIDIQSESSCRPEAPDIDDAGIVLQTITRGHIQDSSESTSSEQHGNSNVVLPDRRVNLVSSNVHRVPVAVGNWSGAITRILSSTRRISMISDVTDLPESRHRLLEIEEANNEVSSNSLDLACLERNADNEDHPSDEDWTREREKIGSSTGLTSEAERAVSWIHLIPWYFQPVLPAIFNLCNSAMRWASLVYITASVAEMLISGLELILSVVAARFIRKRNVSLARWAGVGFVAVGIVLVGAAEMLSNAPEARNMSEEDPDDTADNDDGQLIGILLIIGQCGMSVFQDIAEEIFIQEAELSVTLLLGMEGLIGLVFGIFLYFPIAPLLGERPTETWELLQQPGLAWYAVGLTFLVLITGIFNILATGVTSSMTRNVWKNLRTALVWIIGLIIFYSTTYDDLGEEWVMPGSIFILGGFAVMAGGITVYYRNK